MAAPLWVMVANASEARILEYRGPENPMELLKEIPHPEGRKKGRDLITDRPGKNMRGASKASHAYDPPISAEQHEAELFARHLADYLDKEGALRKFDRLVLVAPPSFLGLLRKSLSKPLAQKIIREIPKDLPSTWVSDHHLKIELRDTLNLP